jgi:DnaK suppressor protein
MDKTQLGYYKNLILAKREKLLHSLNLLKENGLNSTPLESTGELSAYSYHMADQGTDNMEREKSFLFASREENYLYHLNHALERIDKGDYGMCVSCGQPIGPERLEAVPHARLCIDCKSKEERGKS